MQKSHLSYSFPLNSNMLVTVNGFHLCNVDKGLSRSSINNTMMLYFSSIDQLTTVVQFVILPSRVGNKAQYGPFSHNSHHLTKTCVNSFFNSQSIRSYFRMNN